MEVRNLAREYGPQAILTLARIMNNSRLDPRLRVMAADSLLDRGYGRPLIGFDPENPLPPMPTSIALIPGEILPQQVDELATLNGSTEH
jgi:hypothetical protein